MICWVVIKHGDRFCAHARKFNHELMRTESETTIALYTVHVRTVNNEKRALLAEVAVHAHRKLVNKQIYTVLHENLPCPVHGPVKMTAI